MTLCRNNSIVADIDLVNVSRRFGNGGKSVEALRDVTLRVGQSEFVSVLGPSGCGKSTLLRIVAGLVPATSGSVLVQGVQVTEPLSDVGIVFQSAVLLPWRSVIENVLLQADIRRLDRAEYTERASALLKLVGLDGFESSYPHQLSGGMQQRVSICRALVHMPKLLLMDEPFGALDALTRDEMSLELQRIWMERRKTVLFITHSIPEAVFLSDRVLVMTSRPGRILEDLEVDLPRPRTLETLNDARFGELAKHLRRVLYSTR